MHAKEVRYKAPQNVLVNNKQQVCDFFTKQDHITPISPPNVHDGIACKKSFIKRTQYNIYHTTIQNIVNLRIHTRISITSWYRH